MDYKGKLEKEYLKQKDILKKADLIILYGNSIIACILKVAIRQLGFKAECVVFDKGKYLDKDKKMSFNQIKVVIFCSIRKATRESMYSDGVNYFTDSKMFDFYAIYYRWITEVVKRKCDYHELAETLMLLRQDKCIFNIDSINTLYCNLNCKECSNGVPYRKEKRKITAESQVYYLNKITEKLPIAECNFQGGEVFTDTNFSEFILKHSYNARVGIFSIATNATILPKDEVFQTIRSIGSIIRISDYGKLSVKKTAIINKCNEFDIPCFIFPMAQTWRKFGKYKKRNRSEVELKQICKECCFGTHDLMFVEDKIFCCLRTLFASAIGKEDEAVLCNTMDLRRDFSLEELESFVCGDHLWKMCDYCDYPMTETEPAEQL